MKYRGDPLHLSKGQHEEGVRVKAGSAAAESRWSFAQVQPQPQSSVGRTGHVHHELMKAGRALSKFVLRNSWLLHYSPESVHQHHPDGPTSQIPPQKLLVWARNVAQLVECLLKIHDVLGSLPTLGSEYGGTSLESQHLGVENRRIRSSRSSSAM